MQPKTGLMLTTPMKNRFWHPCPDPDTGLREMESICFTYGAAWRHPESILEFGTSDGKVFTAEKAVWPGKAP